MACPSGKTTYLSKRDAKRSLRRIRSQPPLGDERVRHVYRCPLCRRWHLTKQEPRKR